MNTIEQTIGALGLFFSGLLIGIVWYEFKLYKKFEVKNYD